MYNLSLDWISQIQFKNTCKTHIYLQFYDSGIMFMGSFPFGGMLGSCWREGMCMLTLMSEKGNNHETQVFSLSSLLALLSLPPLSLSLSLSLSLFPSLSLLSLSLSLSLYSFSLSLYVSLYSVSLYSVSLPTSLSTLSLSLSTLSVSVSVSLSLSLSLY